MALKASPPLTSPIGPWPTKSSANDTSVAAGHQRCRAAGAGVPVQAWPAPHRGRLDPGYGIRDRLVLAGQHDWKRRARFEAIAAHYHCPRMGGADEPPGV